MFVNPEFTPTICSPSVGAPAPCLKEPHPQHCLLVSVSLKKGKAGEDPFDPLQGQHSTFGVQLGFSQTSSHLGLGQFGLWHFQSHFGSSHTASHSGFGAYILFMKSL